MREYGNGQGARQRREAHEPQRQARREHRRDAHGGLEQHHEHGAAAQREAGSRGACYVCHTVRVCPLYYTPHPHLGTSQSQRLPHLGLHAATAVPMWGWISEAPGVPFPPPCPGFCIHYKTGQRIATGRARHELPSRCATVDLPRHALGCVQGAPQAVYRPLKGTAREKTAGPLTSPHTHETKTTH